MIVELDPYDFEKLCARVLRLLGVEEPVLTRRGADEGIDFFGRLGLQSILFPRDLGPTIQKQLKIWIVGQAKQYGGSQAGTPELRNLVGAVELGKSAAYGSSESPLAGLNIRAADPTFILFITSGSISLNGWRLLERSGVLGVDGQMLSAFLADRGVGMGEGQFEPAEFESWLQSS